MIGKKLFLSGVVCAMAGFVLAQFLDKKKIKDTPGVIGWPIAIMFFGGVACAILGALLWIWGV